MTQSLLRLLFLAFGLAIFLPSGPAQAQSCGVEFEIPCPPPPPEDNKPAAVGASLNTSYTKSIVKLLKGATLTCDDSLELRYRIDCLRIYYGMVADKLPNTGEYLPIKKAMREAEARLEAIVAANVDTEAPVLRPREGHKPMAKRIAPVRAVKAAAAEKAAAEAEAVIKETELVILRSGGDPARRTQHYTDIAAAVEDNLVVLRSA